MTISHNQMKLVYVAKTKLKLSEEQYRSSLVQIGGVTSITDLEDIQPAVPEVTGRAQGDHRTESDESPGGLSL